MKIYINQVLQCECNISFIYFSQAFMSDMRNSWLLPNHPNVSRVLAACTQGDPVCVVSEWVMPGEGFLGGDLCEFLKQHSNTASAINSNSKVNNTGFVDVHNTSSSSKSSSVVTVTTSSSSPGSSSHGTSGLR